MTKFQRWLKKYGSMQMYNDLNGIVSYSAVIKWKTDDNIPKDSNKLKIIEISKKSDIMCDLSFEDFLK